MKNKSLIITIIVALVVAGVGFFGGIKYQQSKRGNFTQLIGRNGNVQGVQTGNRNTGIRPVSGSIISADASSITVKLIDGSSKIIILSDTTQINQATTAAKTDLKVGETVAAFGTQNSDGSITAQSISINPQGLGQPVK